MQLMRTSVESSTIASIGYSEEAALDIEFTNGAEWHIATGTFTASCAGCTWFGVTIADRIWVELSRIARSNGTSLPNIGIRT